MLIDGHAWSVERAEHLRRHCADRHVRARRGLPRGSLGCTLLGTATGVYLRANREAFGVAPALGENDAQFVESALGARSRSTEEESITHCSSTLQRRVGTTSEPDRYLSLR